MNNTVAILVDGGFYQRRAKTLWGSLTAEQRAVELERYCRYHIDSHDKLYRIFYYDCKPLDINVYHPLTKSNISMKNSDLYHYRNAFHAALITKRKIALRWGRLSNNDTHYNLTYETTKALLSGKLKIADLNEHHFAFNTTKKGVDMCIGLDISSLAYKKLVNQIILISGDSDFVPAAKLARREGIDFMLDPMLANINLDLQEHIDGIKTPINKDANGNYISPYHKPCKPKKYRKNNHKLKS